MRNKTKNKMKNKRKTRGGAGNEAGNGAVNGAVNVTGNGGEKNLLEPLTIGNDMVLIVKKVNNIIDYLKMKNPESSPRIINKNGTPEASGANE